MDEAWNVMYRDEDGHMCVQHAGSEGDARLFAIALSYQHAVAVAGNGKNLILNYMNGELTSEIAQVR